MKTYTPSKKVLENYAKVMVNFGANNGKGVKKGDTVHLVGYESAKPLYAAIAKQITLSGANIIHDYRIDDPQYPIEREFYQHASSKQLTYLSREYYTGLLNEVDHMIFIISESDKHALAKIDPKKIMQHRGVLGAYRNMRSERETKGEFSWTMCLYGTESMAHEAGLSLRQYWNQIIKACYLNDSDPIARWRKADKILQETVKKLDALSIEKIHIKGEDVDLHMELSPMSKWIAGGGCNIPSFEVFTSPNWRGTNGWIRFNQSLYRYGTKIEGIYLEFKDGVVIKAKAKKGQKVLREMIAVKNANKIGEFSLTDGRISYITKFMAETLYDENRGGRYGNTHIALGASFKECYKGDSQKLSDEDWENLGFNQSAIHTDIISTSDRTVTALLSTGKKKIIYQDGKFTL